jgi:fatty-acyl-CoA synthase
LVSGLVEIGVTPGSTVLTLAWNTVEYLECALAVPSLGAVLDHLNVRLASVELARLASATRPAAIIVAADLLSDSELGRTVGPIVTEQGRSGVPIVVIGTPTSPINVEFVSFESLLAHPPSDIDDTAFPDELAPAFIFHTGGTTGSPKSYKISHRESVLHSLVEAGATAMAIRAEDRVLPLPQFFHANAWNMPFVAILAGADIVFPGRDVSGEHIAWLMRAENVTLAAGVPTLWYRICEAIRSDPSLRPTSVREVICSGASLDDDLLVAVRDSLGCTVATGWGMTETMGMSTYERADDRARIGRPVALMEITSTDGATDTSPHSPGIANRMLVRGPLIVAAERGDWYFTGDIAAVDADGVVRLKDREKDVIKSGGEWIPSLELERFICTHESVISAAVVPRPNAQWGERPVAFVVLREGSLLSVSALRAHLIDRGVPRWWAPEEVINVAELPLTRLGKVDKNALREQVASAR